MDENVINSQRTIPSSAAQPLSHAVVSRDDDTIWSGLGLLFYALWSQEIPEPLLGKGLSNVFTHFALHSSPLALPVVQ